MNNDMCPKFEYAMNLMSQRWTGLIIYQLLDGPSRFNDLEKSIGISARVLSERLKDLEAEKIVNRIVYPETPVRIEYSLTEKGKSLKSVMDNISDWASVWIEV